MKKAKKTGPFKRKKKRTNAKPLAQIQTTDGEFHSIRTQSFMWEQMFTCFITSHEHEICHMSNTMPLLYT